MTREWTDLHIRLGRIDLDHASLKALADKNEDTIAKLVRRAVKQYLSTKEIGQEA